MTNEIAIRKMMEACDQDPNLRARLFQDPMAVAKEYKVELTGDEVTQLKRVGELVGLVAQFKTGRIGGRGPLSGYPVGYPIDQWWKQVIFNHVISYRTLYNPLFNPIFYPIGYVFNVRRQELAAEAVQLRHARRKT